MWCQAYGTRDWYVQKLDGGEIYLVDDELLRPLTQAGTRLPDQRLWSFENSDIVLANIQLPSGVSLKAMQHDPGAEKARWATIEKPGHKAPELEAAMAKLMKSRNGSEYLAPDETLTSPVPQLVILLQTEEGKSETVEFFQDGVGDDKTYWAKSEWTRGYLKLQTAKVNALLDPMCLAVTGVTCPSE